MSDRDTHFAGFARLLMEELDIDPINDLTQQIIAQRAYDLAMHVLDYSPLSWIGGTENMLDYLQNIPDITEWPQL